MADWKNNKVVGIAAAVIVVLVAALIVSNIMNASKKAAPTMPIVENADDEPPQTE